MNKDIDFIELLKEISNSPYTALLELLHTGIAVLSKDGFFMYANKAFLEMFSLDDKIVNKHVSEFFLTAEQGVMRTIKTQKITINSSFTTTNAQGISIRYPVFDEEGKFIGVIIESISSSMDNAKLLELLDTVRNLEEKANYFEQKNQRKTGSLHTFDSILGESETVREMKKLGRRFSQSRAPILVFGESGTGKELVAQALHSSSPRVGQPFVPVNCAALPADLIESELFGYGAGAFTGAKASGVKGKFELADKGTIFLDEIGELPLPMQAKLLRVLETGEIQKLAHTETLYSDFRLIAATNKNLEESVEKGLFRADLYHRLRILELYIPPLRDRITDIPLLTRTFIEEAVGVKRAKEIKISNDVYRVFHMYEWRGNIRELKNVITYSLYALDEGHRLLTTDNLPERLLQEICSTENIQIEQKSFMNRICPTCDQTISAEDTIDSSEDNAYNLKEIVVDAERNALLSVLQSTKYNKTRAAQILGISRNKLYKKLKEFGL